METIQYHIVWCVKYRHKIITEQMENRFLGDPGYFLVKVSENKGKRKWKTR